MKENTASKPLALLVEHDNELADQCCYTLSIKGYHYRRVLNREEALTRLELEVPEVLVVDVSEEVDVGARDILQRLQTDERLTGVKTVLIAENEESVREFQAKVGAILYKPIHGQQLVEVVDELMGR